MLLIKGTVLLGIKPRRNRSTDPFRKYLLGLMMTTRSEEGRDAPATLHGEDSIENVLLSVIDTGVIGKPRTF
jgi:hypothetical protein